MDFIVIPALNPDYRLIDLVKELSIYQMEGLRIIVVNDGSESRCNSVFRIIKDYAILLEHETNRGKGRAIKTALQYIRRIRAEKGIVVTADADGQHKVGDIISVLLKAREMPPDVLVLGSRTFDKKTPFRSRFGNKITSMVYFLMTGKRIKDTQTGLRAFHTACINDMLMIKGERYEYEMNVLLKIAASGRTVVHVPIQTIYIEENKSSHFRVIRDSSRIYLNLLRFCSSSLMSFVADYSLFYMLTEICTVIGIAHTKGIIISNLCARVISSSFNFTVNRYLVFRHKGSVKNAAIRYFSLAAGMLVMNTCLLTLFSSRSSLGIMAVKILVESICFVLNFLVQQFHVFPQIE